MAAKPAAATMPPIRPSRVFFGLTEPFAAPATPRYPPRPMLVGALLLALVGAFQAPVTKSFADETIVARGQDSVLLWKDLDELFLIRHSMSKDGREGLRHLAESLLLEKLWVERGVQVKESQVDARWKELDTQMRAVPGNTNGIGDSLKTARLSVEEFRRYLRLSFVQEMLTRRALGLGDEAAVSGDQQKLWMDETLAERQYVELPPPWKDGLVARAAGFQVTPHDYLLYLRQRMPEKDLREDCYALLLLRRMRARMPDVAPAKLDEYVKAEIERRRRESDLDPKHKGVPFEQLLGAQGLAFANLPRDASVQVAALSKLWVDRSYNDEALRHVYADEREYYDNLFGEALDTSMLFLRAVQFKKEAGQRTYAEAEGILKGLESQLTSAEAFAKAAHESSEDADSRENGGALGWISPGNPRIPEEIRVEVRKHLGARTTPTPPAGDGLAGPLRTPTGSVLLWFGPRRAAPTWEVMSQQVQRELRRRFLEDVLPRANVQLVAGS